MSCPWLPPRHTDDLSTLSLTSNSFENLFKWYFIYKLTNQPPLVLRMWLLPPSICSHWQFMVLSGHAVSALILSENMSLIRKLQIYFKVIPGISGIFFFCKQTPNLLKGLSRETKNVLTYKWVLKQCGCKRNDRSDRSTDPLGIIACKLDM